MQRVAERSRKGKQMICKRSWLNLGDIVPEEVVQEIEKRHIAREVGELSKHMEDDVAYVIMIHRKTIREKRQYGDGERDLFIEVGCNTLVTCGMCMHFYGRGYCDLHIYGQYTRINPKWFCAYGEWGIQAVQLDHGLQRMAQDEEKLRPDPRRTEKGSDGIVRPEKRDASWTD